MANTRDRYSLEDAKRWLEEFEALLKQYGIAIQPGSQLEAVGLETYRIWDAYRGCDEIATEEELRELFKEAMGFHDLMRHILEVREHKDFVNLLPHLRLLNGRRVIDEVRKQALKKPVTRHFSQNVPSASLDQESNKVFELLVASICMHFADTVKVDAPSATKGDNPDVIFEYQGERFALACKTAHSQSAQTYFDLIKDGIRQIENSDARWGFPLVNLKNLIRHETFWRTNGKQVSFSPFGSFESFGQAVWKETEEIVIPRLNKIDRQELANAFTGKCPATILSFCQTSGTTNSVETENVESATILGLLQIVSLADLGGLPEVLATFNHWLHHLSREQLGPDEPLVVALAKE